MAEKMDERISRRNWLKYAVAGATTVGVAGAAYYLLTREQPAYPPATNTTSTTPNPPITSQSLTPLASYAKGKGLSNGVTAVLDVKLGGEATENNKSFVDYLYGVSQADVVSPEVLQFAPEEYKPSVVESLQFKAIGDVIKENKVPDQAVKPLGYLSGFPGAVQRNTIEFGLDDTTLEFLGLTAGLSDQEFAKYAVEWRVPIQNHELTDLKRKFLQEPGNYAKDLFVEYVAEMMSAGGLNADLAKEVKKLPESAKVDLQAVDSAGDINDLFLNATNPEIKEAGELMLKGGTPYPKDFKYSVPNWNTELQILNQLGRQNWFRRNDTLAQAIAMDNGLWVTMGDDEVRAAVYRDTDGILNFGRETSEMQRALGLSYTLEDYPLEAKVCWAWLGGESPLYAKTHSLALFLDKKLDLKSYNWDIVSLDSLKKMRSVAFNSKWWNSDSFKAIDSLENYFYFPQSHWIYSVPAENNKVTIEGEEVGSYCIGNVNWMLDFYLKNNTVVGVSLDEANWICAFGKSLGIATAPLLIIDVNRQLPSHTLTTFYNPSTNEWEVATKQGDMGWYAVTGANYDLYVFAPPVNQHNYPGRINYIKDIRYSDVLYPDSPVYKIILKEAVRADIEKIIQHNGEMKKHLFDF